MLSSTGDPASTVVTVLQGDDLWGCSLKRGGGDRIGILLGGLSAPSPITDGEIDDDVAWPGERMSFRISVLASGGVRLSWCCGTNASGRLLLVHPVLRGDDFVVSAGVHDVGRIRGSLEAGESLSCGSIPVDGRI
eukprot:SAG31_NODE_774_length_12192_cov_26.736128_4_plen_135_part_00